MVSLCAAAWECSPAAAIRKLAKAGIPIPNEYLDIESINAYVASFPQRQRIMLNFWRQARAKLLKNPTVKIARLMGRLRLTHTFTPERLQGKLGSLFGIATRKDIAEAFGVKQLTHERCRLYGFSSEETMLIPYYDVPNRICGFHVVGVGTPAQRRYLTIFDGAKEAGLAGLNTIEESKAAFKDNYVVVNDAWIAARIQLRHFRMNENPLPLVAYYDEGQKIRTSAFVWNAITHRRPIFWGWRMTPDLLNQAINANGRIHITPVDEITPEVIDHQLSRHEPRKLFHRLIRRAKPWQEALKAWAEKVEPSEVENLLLGLEIYGHDLHGIPCLSDTLTAIGRYRDGEKQFNYKRRRIIERDGKWWCQLLIGKDRGRTYMIMDGVLRIDSVTTDENGESVYNARVIHDGDETPVAIKQTTKFRNLAISLTFAVLRHTQKQLTIASEWGPMLITVATHFHKPKAYQPSVGSHSEPKK
jgi:hypothetical protein